MARRRISRQTGMAIAERHAWAHFGRHHWRVFVYGPYVWRLVVLVAAVVGLALLWINVPHVWLGVAALAAAVLVGGVWFMWTGSNAALQRRMQARASKDTRRGAGLGWAVACLIVLFGMTGWLALWSPYA